MGWTKIYSKILNVLDKTEKGTRFLIKIYPDDPDISVLLVDYPVPADIARHPENGWESIPDWDEEREKGNIRDTPYDTDELPVYTFPKSNSGL